MIPDAKPEEGRVTLTHFSASPLEFDGARVYDWSKRSPPWKPVGLWLSDETSYGWKSWCTNNDWDAEELVHHERFACDVSRWAVLRSEQDLSAFGRHYAESAFSFQKIDWLRVRNDFRGILISPFEYRWGLERESGWCYGWDCASACVWDLSTVKVCERAE